MSTPGWGARRRAPQGSSHFQWVTRSLKMTGVTLKDFRPACVFCLCWSSATHLIIILLFSDFFNTIICFLILIVVHLAWLLGNHSTHLGKSHLSFIHHSHFSFVLAMFQSTFVCGNLSNQPNQLLLSRCLLRLLLNLFPSHQLWILRHQLLFQLNHYPLINLICL